MTSDDGESSDTKPAESVESRAMPGLGPGCAANEETVARQGLPDSGQDVFDDIDWEIESIVQDDAKAMTEEYLNKRRTVMEEKVQILFTGFYSFLL